MRAQHADVASQLNRIEPRLDPWVATADPVLRDARAKLLEHRKQLPRDALSLQLGFLLASVHEDERDEWCGENVPAPVRLLYALLMKRPY